MSARLVPWSEVEGLLGCHAAKYVSLHVLTPLIINGECFVDREEWESLCARFTVADQRRERDWMPERGAALRLTRSLPGEEHANPILSALRRLGVKLK